MNHAVVGFGENLIFLRVLVHQRGPLVRIAGQLLEQGGVYVEVGRIFFHNVSLPLTVGKCDGVEVAEPFIPAD